MKVRFTKFSAVFPFGYYVQWTVGDLDPAESGSFKFSLYRSGGPNGPWETLFEGVDQYSYLDKFNAVPSTFDELQPNSMRMFMEPFYRVVCTLPSGGTAEEIDQTRPQTTDRKMAQYLRKTQRDFRLSLKFNGTRVIVLKKRRWGTRCLKCFDRRTKEVVRPNCRECWGTGFVEGFWAPFLTYARSSTTQNTSVITPSQKSDANDCTFWLPDYPQLERDDVIVRLADQRRFRVDQQVETQIQLNSVHQEVGSQQIPMDNVVYRIPVDPDTLSPLY